MEVVGVPTLVQAMRAHRGEVTCLDTWGARLATGGGDRTLRTWLWAAGSGWQETGAALQAHRYGVTAARYSPAGALLASAGVDGAARVWCARTLAPRRLLGAPAAAAARALCWPAAGDRLLVGHDDGALCVWHVRRGELLARLLAHEGALHAVAAPARGALLLTACTHGVLKVFDLIEVCTSGTECGVTPTPLEWIDGAHDLGALCADATEEGSLAATGGHDARVRVWHAVRDAASEGGKRKLQEWGPPLEGHAAAVTALRWGTRAGRAVLASASLDRTARVWVPDDGGCLRVVHAHPRYLTCIALAHDLQYLITGSNDKSVRMWSMGTFTLADDMEPPCVTLAHFAVGDLEGIGPVDDYDPIGSSCADGAEAVEGGAARCVWVSSRAHGGAINCLAIYKNMLATASSDGLLKLFRWYEEEERLAEEQTLEGHQYPVLAADFGSSGRMLLSAGLDGCACIWDVEKHWLLKGRAQTGVLLRSLSVPSGAGGGAGGGGEAGGGGMRDARVSPHCPPLLLLATDDGLAPLWSLASSDPKPDYTYTGHAEAVTCCAWSWDGRAAATGAASGELRLLAPPAHRALHHEPHAHDLGVQSCDFAPSSSAVELPEGTYLLATAGCDSLFKLWIVELNEAGGSASVRMVRQVEAHGGGVSCVRWGAGGLLATAGADRWARVWRVRAGGGFVALHAAALAEGVGGALAVALLEVGMDNAPLLAVGTLAGELALWRVPRPVAEEEATCEEGEDDEEGTAARFWGLAGVARWMREYVTRCPESGISHGEEEALLRRARDLALCGARLLDAPLDELLDDLGYGEECEASVSTEAGGAGGAVATRARLRDELAWLRRDPPPPHLAATAPHALLCPLTHRVLREPARAPDGFTYERGALAERRLAAAPAEGEESPMSGRRVRSLTTAPNYRLRARLRTFLDEHAPPAPP